MGSKAVNIGLRRITASVGAPRPWTEAYQEGIPLGDGWHTPAYPTNHPTARNTPLTSLVTVTGSIRRDATGKAAWVSRLAVSRSDPDGAQIEWQAENVKPGVSIAGLPQAGFGSRQGRHQSQIARRAAATLQGYIGSSAYVEAHAAIDEWALYLLLLCRQEQAG